MNFAVLFGACACCGAILRLYCSYNVLINYRPCTVIIDGDVCFVAKDVCEVLEINDTHTATRALDDDEKDRQSLPAPPNAELNIFNFMHIFYFCQTDSQNAMTINELVYDERARFFLGRQVEANIISESGLYADKKTKPVKRRFSVTTIGGALFLSNLEKNNPEKFSEQGRIIKL